MILLKENDSDCGWIALDDNDSLEEETFEQLYKKLKTFLVQV